MSPAQLIAEETMIPDLLRAAPQVRPVLDGYGLKGCGGPLGPAESLGFFARAHDVPLGRLLGELRARLARPEPLPMADPEPAPDPASTIYRPFFRAGILVVLTLGASWGAYLLLRIGLGGSFHAAGVHEVNAHGHAQIFGWVGLFVMGFAYQAFPRFKHTTLAHPHLARASLWLMLLGLIARAVLQPFAADYPALIGPAVAASLLELVAVGLFAWIVPATWRRSGKPLATYDWYLVAALFWFVVQAVYEAVYLAATLPATGPDLVALVATWQAPLRDVQIHGFALLMILGVSQRFFHPMYGLPAPTARPAWLALAGINVAVVGEVLGLLLMRLHGHAWAALWYGSVLLLAGSVVSLVRGWHLFTKVEPERSLKFLRAAYVWLFISLALLVLLPVYQFGLLAQLAPESAAARMGFSHAYYGAIRHAITVGFVSLMIVGVASRVVPTLNGVPASQLTRLWAPFVLLNVGCALRVSGQIMTDLTASAFPVAGVSGLLEVTGLALWGAHLWAVMAGWHSPANEDEALPLGTTITAKHAVGVVLERYPHLLETFLAFGFAPLAAAAARATVARHVTLAAACRWQGTDLATLLATLNARRTAPTPTAEGACCSHRAAETAARRSLPILP